MTKKHFCDRCGKELDIQPDDFDEMVESVNSAFGNEDQILKPQLCKKCEKGYKKIIAETNKKIENHVQTTS